jgi:dsRNA-specific ribonuclease
MSSYSEKNRDEIYDSLTKLFEENGWDTGTIDNWTNAIVDMGPEFRGLAESIDANTEALKTENDIIAASALENNANIQASKYKDDIINASGEIYNELYKKEMEILEKGGYGTANLHKGHGTGGDAKKYWNEYLQAAGLNANDYKLVDTTGTDTNRQFVYRQGDEEKKIDLQTMKVAIASARAMEKLGESAEYLMKEFIRLGSVAENTDEGKANRGLISFLSDKNLEGATRG